MASRNYEHIDKQFDAELRLLKDKLLLMGHTVSEHLAGTMRALGHRDTAAAARMASSDWRVNRLEMECDGQCVRMIALRQPAASDLRFLVAALKIDTDLERIGDLVVNIAERVEWLSRSSLSEPALDLSEMATAVENLLRDALGTLQAGDAEAAGQLLLRDAHVDGIFASTFNALVTAIQGNPACIERAIRLLFIAKHLERIADHATNIAEMVVYMVHGTDVRHRFSAQEEAAGSSPDRGEEVGDRA